MMKNSILPPSDKQLTTYARQWGATAIPFNDGSGFFQSEQTRQATQMLDQSAALKSLMLLAGPNGVGKSALVGQWIENLDPQSHEVVALTQATLSGGGILSVLVSKLRKEPSIRRERNLVSLEEALNELSPRTLVLVLDEAQHYTHAALEEVRLLLGLNLKSQPTFSLILIGDEYLLATLRLRHHQALFSRIAYHYQLDALKPEEVAQFIIKALNQVGIDQNIFEPAAMDLLTSASAGMFRTLCLLARAAWIQASQNSEQMITAAHIQQAIKQVPCTPGIHSQPHQTQTT